jgi:hypothetical protein
MGQVNDGIPCLIDLMKDEITEEFDNISVASFGPSCFTGESVQQSKWSDTIRTKRRDGILRPFVDKSKLAEKANKTSIF